MLDELSDYRYRGARAMVLLHEQHMRAFWDAWQTARELDVELPQSKSPNYVSLDTLLAHVLISARRYMIWICEQLELPDPEINPAPEADVAGAEAERYLEHLFQQWRKPLVQIPEVRFYRPEYTSWWKVQYCIDAMLEHAVMHPIRHRFQLLELMEHKSKS